MKIVKTKKPKDEKIRRRLVEICNKIRNLDSKLEVLEYHKKTLQYCYEFLETLGYWNDFINSFNANERIFGIISALQLVDPDHKGEFLINEEAIKNQFYNLEGENEIEIYANLMYVSNKIAHLIKDNHWLSDWLGFDAKSMFFNIKLQCMDALILLEDASKKNIFIEQSEDSKGNKVIMFALPNYFEPFSVHVLENANENFNILHETGIEYFSQENKKIARIPLFPFKMSEKQKEIIQSLYKMNLEMGDDSKFALQWYLTMKDKFEGKETNTEVLGGNKKKEMRRKPQEKVNYSKVNKIFWETLNKKYGNILNKTIINSILDNSSYSYLKLFEKLESMIKDNLIQLYGNDKEYSDRIEKIFIYIKLTESTSRIQSGMVNKSTLREIILNSICNYEKAWEYLEKYRGVKDIGIREMKNAIQKYIETDGKMDILKEKGKSRRRVRKRRSVGHTKKTKGQRKPYQSLETDDNTTDSKGLEESKREAPDEAMNNDTTNESAMDNETEESNDIFETIIDLKTKATESITNLEKTKPSTRIDYLKALLPIEEMMNELLELCDQILVEPNEITKAEDRAAKSKKIADELSVKAQIAQAEAEKDQDNLNQIREKQRITQEITNLRKRTEGFYKDL